MYIAVLVYSTQVLCIFKLLWSHKNAGRFPAWVHCTTYITQKKRWTTGWAGATAAAAVAP